MEGIHLDTSTAIYPDIYMQEEVSEQTKSVIAPTVRRGSSEDLQRKFFYDNSYQIEAARRQLEERFHEEDERLFTENSKNVELVKALCLYGKNAFHLPALHLAVKAKDIDSVRVLVACGAVVSDAVVALAKKEGSDKVLEVLVKADKNQSPGTYKFRVTKKEYNFFASTEFEIDSDNFPIHFVSKPCLSFNTHYKLNGSNGLEATGTVPLLSFGSFYTWAKQIFLYDEKGYYLGSIKGLAFTMADAKFIFRDKNGGVKAIAYLDDNKTGFSIVHPENYARVIARLKREYVQDVPDTWETRVYHGEDLDPRFIQIFSAFAADTAKYFKIDK